jgi:hypothetical protein
MSCRSLMDGLELMTYAKNNDDKYYQGHFDISVKRDIELNISPYLITYAIGDYQKTTGLGSLKD